MQRERKRIYIYTEFAAIPIPNPELEFDFFLCDCARQGLYRCIVVTNINEIRVGCKGCNVYKRARKKKKKNEPWSLYYP